MVESRDLETKRDKEGFREGKMLLCSGEEDAKHMSYVIQSVVIKTP
jgi:hypothetical protein